MIAVVNVDFESVLEQLLQRDDESFHYNTPSHLSMCSTYCNDAESNVFLELDVVLPEVKLIFGGKNYGVNLLALAHKLRSIFRSCRQNQVRLFHNN